MLRPTVEPDATGEMEGKPPGWVRAELARELARAADPLAVPVETVSTARLSQLADELERRLRADAAARLPAEESLKSGAGWKRAVKLLIFRALRPLSRRYDRIGSELAAVQTSLAQRIERAEAEIARLSAGMQTAPASVIEPAAADHFYQRFENTMRGPSELISARLSRYAGRIRDHRAGADQEETPLWVDLGCGRGEFGSLLTEWGWAFQGVDGSALAVEACRRLGLAAVQEDVLGYLKRYTGRPPLGISAIQVIEHLPKERWVAFFLEARRIIAPGGVLLVETVNPLNLEALAQSFFADVTHTWPPHPETLKLMADFAGFERAEVEFLQGDDGEGGPPDYALWAFASS